MEKPITENEVLSLGFKLVNQYEHDQYITREYQLGVMRVELSFEGDKVLMPELFINLEDGIPVDFKTLKTLAPILGRDYS